MARDGSNEQLETDSMDTPSFDRSSFVVVRTNSQTQRRRRTGSFGECQPEPASSRSLSQWEFDATFDDDAPVEDRNVVMMEQYNSLRRTNPQKRLTAKDFMDGSDFMDSTNLFRDSHTSQRWHMDIMERPSYSFEEPKDHDVDQLFQELSLNASEKQQQCENNSGVSNTRTNPASPLQEKEEDHETEPTTPPTEPTTTPPSSLPSSTGRQKAKKDHKKKHKKKESKKKSKRRGGRLPSVVPPNEIDVSDCVTVASSIGGLSPIRHKNKIRSLLDQEQCLPRPPIYMPQAINTPALREVDVSAPMTVASSVGQESAWVNPTQSRFPSQAARSSPKEPSHHERRLQSSRRRASLNLDKVKSSLEIDIISDPTVVSALGESNRRMNYHALPSSPERIYPQQSLHHRLYQSNICD